MNNYQGLAKNLQNFLRNNIILIMTSVFLAISVLVNGQTGRTNEQMDGLTYRHTYKIYKNVYTKINDNIFVELCHAFGRTNDHRITKDEIARQTYRKHKG